MKKTLIILLSLVLFTALLLSGCDKGNNVDPDEDKIALLLDNKFQDGFSVMPANNSPDTYPINFDLRLPGTSSDSAIMWTVAQWGSKTGFGDSYGNTLITGHAPYEPIKTGDTYRYETETKAFEINPIEGSLTFELTTSKEYVDNNGNIKPRSASVEPWVHLLIEQGFSDMVQVKDTESIVLTMDIHLTKMVNMFGSATYNPNLHAAQFLMYLVVKSVNPMDSEYMWFGIPLYDNRYTTIAESGMIDTGENKFLYSMPSNDYIPGGLVAGASIENKVSVNFDIVPYFERALNICKTQHNRFLNSTADDLYIQGMNLGWEIPGVFDVSVTVSNLSLTANKK